MLDPSSRDDVTALANAGLAPSEFVGRPASYSATTTQKYAMRSGQKPQPAPRCGRYDRVRSTRHARAANARLRVIAIAFLFGRWRPHRGCIRGDCRSIQTVAANAITGQAAGGVYLHNGPRAPCKDPNINKRQFISQQVAQKKGEPKPSPVVSPFKLNLLTARCLFLPAA